MEEFKVRHNCDNHTKTQQDIDAIREMVYEMKSEILLLKNTMVEQDEMSDIQKEIAKLSAQLEMVVRDRKEDMKMIQQLRDEVQSMSEELRGYAVTNENLKVNQEYTLDSLKDICDRLKSIEKNTTFNWLEMANNFANENILRKIFSVGTLALIGSLFIGGVWWVFTGDNIFPQIMKTIQSLQGVAK
jgi:septal ring factor EnvC (AmiA/AmiB activator)